MLITGDDGVVRKYSCEKCIKGHRTSGCKHSNSPLIEIKKKGRPSTQCEHCRELRKTKHMHVKCICPGRQALDARSRSRSSPYSRESSPTHSREPSPLHMDIDTTSAQTNIVMNYNMDLSEPLYTSSVSSEGTMTPTESSASCSPIFSGSVGSEVQQPHIAQDSDFADVQRTPLHDKGHPSTAIDPFKLRYHLQRTLNTSLVHSASATVTSTNSPLYSPITSPRTPPIPINDPTDDLDSDTPIYKNEDGEPAVDQAAVLGDLHHTSSEDLMDEIYSGFTDNIMQERSSSCGSCCQCGDSCECAGCALHHPNTHDVMEPPSTSTVGHIRTNGEPTVKIEPIIDDDGVQLCGCGCMKSLESCRDCFQDLCEEYLLSHPHP